MKKIATILVAIGFLVAPSAYATTLQVPGGGTGATSFTAGQCLIGNGTSPFTSGPCGSVSTTSANAWSQQQAFNGGLTFTNATGTGTTTLASLSATLANITTLLSTYFTATNATTTNLTTTNLTLGTLSGLLKAASGIVSQATAGADYVATTT